MKGTLVDPTEVFSFALQKRASKLIMVHNHPGGTLSPSFEDKDITDRMYQVGQFLDLPVIDHLIITETEFYSFVESGLLFKLSRSKRYVLKYKKEIERITKIGVKIGRKEGREEGVKIGATQKAIQMAKIMKKDGRKIEEIMRYTRLSKMQIEKL
jgi:DNA repair protein RadC